MVSDVTDRHGRQAARIDHPLYDTDRANIGMAKQTMRDILSAAGAERIFGIDRYAHLVDGHRPGSEPELSVVDRDHRTSPLPDLFVADGSVLLTHVAANPVTARPH